MDRQTIGKIIGATLALGIIITSGVLAIHEVDFAEAAFWAGIGIAGGLGTLFAPRLGEPKAEPPPPSGRRGRRTPPTLPVLALALTALASGCGGQAWDAHAYTALTLRDASNGANEALRDAHRDYLRTRGATAETVEDVAALSQRWREAHSEVLHVQRAAADATNAYARGVFLALRGEEVDFNEILRVGVDAARSLLAIGRLMADAGIDWVSEVPPWALDLLGVESAGEETSE